MSGFAFKQFKIEHDQCAMKVSTDGILLGAWVNLTQAQSLLDIGTGTGLLALMCKQRKPKLAVTAVEIETNAYHQALTNVAHSPWPDISVHQQSIQNFVSEHTFDVIISNPPYFNNSLKSDDAKRNTARHTDTLSFIDLIAAMQRLGHAGSRFSVILPCAEAVEFVRLAEAAGLFLNALCRVQATANKPFSRSLITLSYRLTATEYSELCIGGEQERYSEHYKALCNAFYLKM